jgi:hypothetical protein
LQDLGLKKIEGTWIEVQICVVLRIWKVHRQTCARNRERYRIHWLRTDNGWFDKLAAWWLLGWLKESCWRVSTRAVWRCIRWIIRMGFFPLGNKDIRSFVRAWNLAIAWFQCRYCTFLGWTCHAI